MKFYFVHESGEASYITSITNGDIYDTLVKSTEEEPRHSGFVGVIDESGKLRGTLAINQFRGPFRNALYDFVRKYRAIEVLEGIAQREKERAK